MKVRIRVRIRFDAALTAAQQKSETKKRNINLKKANMQNMHSDNKITTDYNRIW